MVQLAATGAQSQHAGMQLFVVSLAVFVPMSQLLRALGEFSP